MTNDSAAVIVAGGSGRRLGSPAGGKAAVLLGGQSLLQRVVAAVSDAIPRLVIVKAAGQSLPPLATGPGVIIDVVDDSQPGGGPLAAVVDGMRFLAASRRPPAGCLLASCDLPQLSAGVVRYLLEVSLSHRAEAWAVPQVAGHPQPLVSVMPLSLLPTVEQYLGLGRRDLRGLMEAVPTRLVDEAALRGLDPELASFLDIDTAKDLATISRTCDTPPPAEA